MTRIRITVALVMLVTSSACRRTIHSSTRGNSAQPPAAGSGATHAAPALASVTPANGPASGSTAIELRGANFSADTSAQIGNQACNNIVVESAELLRCIVPPGSAGQADVIVTNADGLNAALPKAYTYEGAPRLAGILPLAGRNSGGTRLEIAGDGLRPGTTVTVGGDACGDVSIESPQLLHCTTNAHADGPVPVSLTDSAGQTGTVNDAYTFFHGLALGQNSRSESTVSTNGMWAPADVALSGQKLFVTDLLNNRILVWNTLPTASDTPPDFVLGQPDLSSTTANTGGVSARTLSGPDGLAVAGGKLFVADAGNNRVLIWNTIPTASFTPADVVIGQPDMAAHASGLDAKHLNGPRGVASDGTYVAIADAANNRVLIYNSVPTTSFAAADVVLGQPDFVQNTENNDASARKQIKSPYGVLFSGSKLVVANTYDQNLQIWNSIPAANQPAADVVVTGLGYPAHIALDGAHLLIAQVNSHAISVFNSIPTTDTTRTASQAFYLSQSSGAALYQCRGVAAAGGKVVVADLGRNRVLIWNTSPSAQDQHPDLVLGQADMNGTDALPRPFDRRNLRIDGGYTFDARSGHLIVGDEGNNRVLIWNEPPTTDNQPADVVLGQADLDSVQPNAGLGTGACDANTLQSPSGVSYDGKHLFVSDRYNNRVLIWNALPKTNGTPADLVLGQSSFTALGSKPASATTLRNPGAIYSDGTRLFVAEIATRRILVWSHIPTSSNQSADFVLGAPDLDTDPTSAVTPSRFSSVNSMFVQSGRLYVASMADARVLVWTALPSANDTPADLFLGQPDGTSSVVNNGGLSAASFASPRGITGDGKRILISDGVNQRVLLWETPPSGQDADAVIGQDSFTTINRTASGIGPETFGNVSGITTDGARLYIADREFRRIEMLPLQ